MNEEKFNWIDEKQVNKCTGTGQSKWTTYGDKHYQITICRYDDTVIDLKIKMVDFIKDREASCWMSLHEAQILMKALEEFFK